jgi:long-chain acyl-CoA synthetase
MKVKNNFLAQVFVYGDSLRSHPVVVAVPDESFLLPWAKTNGFADKSFEELCASPEINKMILDQIIKEGRQNGLKGFEVPKGLYLSSKTFEALNILTPTFKIKRHDAKKVFIHEIEALYASS